MNDVTKNLRVGLFRRLMAIFYDLFLLLAILFVITIIATIINSGEAIDSNHPYYVSYALSLLAISFFYYGWFWTHGGQTLGMQTWKMKLINDDNTPISWIQVCIRTVSALISLAFAGFGFIWSLFDKDKRTWHDMLSRSFLIDLRDNKN